METQEKPDYELAREELEALVAELFTKRGENPQVILIGASMDEDKWQCIDFCLYIGAIRLDYHVGLGHLELQRAVKNRPNSKLTSNEENFLAHWAKRPSADFMDKDLQVKLAGKLAALGYVKKPTAAEILGAYCRDGRDTECPFEDWASNLGYDPDSRKAYAIYQDGQQKWFQLIAIFGRAGCEKMGELASRL